MSLFELKQKIDRNIFRIFNFASDIGLLLSARNRQLLANNKIYQNKHQGERCFILGTGPSLTRLTADQVTALTKETIFAVNSFYKVSIVDSITPKYYALMDNNYWGISKNTFKDVSGRYKENPPVLITDTRASQLIPHKIKSILIYAKNYPVDRMRYDLSENLSITMNVVSFSLLTAIYMGFKEIYLLGCDYNSFCSRSSNHCYNDETEINELPSYNLAFYLKYYHLTTEFHYAIAILARKKGVKIINLTIESLLDAYPTGDLSIIL
ncbi:DUF115 domain-containing protein [Candidatus Parcubacteria bacterium]|nr:DUF115 domain-containing protein [Candidatus Parcubacteria bacterium]